MALPNLTPAWGEPRNNTCFIQVYIISFSQSDSSSGGLLFTKAV